MKHPSGRRIPDTIRMTVTGLGAWRSPVAHLLWEQGVAGSNPAAPTMTGHTLRLLPHSLLLSSPSLLHTTRT